MNKPAEEQRRNLPDVTKFIETVESFDDFFDKDAEIFIARAPGRLDVMGGIADYSGSLVLEMPIREAALAAVQKTNEKVLQIKSLGAEENHRANFFEMPLADLESDGNLISYARASEKFRADDRNNWAAYVAGAFLVLSREKNFRFERGARILIDSKVPEGKGVSSSAALEVAAMSAIAAVFEIEIKPRELAILCQKVENLVVGAPCGIMDQMSAAVGVANRFLRMICQPAEVLEAQKIPEEIAFWGIDSGVRHSVGAGDYGSVRTGAFIGYRIIADIAGLRTRETETAGVIEITDARWNGYLANITPAEFEKNFAARLPEKISGADFQARYKGITDRVTKILPEKNYAVLSPTAHPIYENFRVHEFARTLNEPTTEENLQKLGALMYQSHESYTACGLGTQETDFLVKLVEESKNLYGAKITGGGSGGTVAVLGKKNARAEIERIAAVYEKQNNHRPYIFSGSSNGASRFGILKLRL